MRIVIINIKNKSGIFELSIKKLSSVCGKSFCCVSFLWFRVYDSTRHKSFFVCLGLVLFLKNQGIVKVGKDLQNERAIALTLPAPPPNQMSPNATSTPFKPSRDGGSTTSLHSLFNHPFCEEIFPNIQSKPPLEGNILHSSSAAFSPFKNPGNS